MGRGLLQEPPELSRSWLCEEAAQVQGAALMGVVCLHQDLGENADGKVCEVKL